MSLIKEIQSIMLACVDSNSYGQDDSVEQLMAKNSNMREKLSIVISTIEEQMSAIGNDMSGMSHEANTLALGRSKYHRACLMSSFFDSVAADQKDEKN